MMSEVIEAVIPPFQPIDETAPVEFAPVVEERQEPACPGLPHHHGGDRHAGRGDDELAAAAGAHAPAEKMHAPVAPPAERHALDGQRVGEPVRAGADAEPGDPAAEVPHQEAEQRHQQPDGQVVRVRAVAHAAVQDALLHPLQPVRGGGAEGSHRHCRRIEGRGHSGGDGDVGHPLHSMPRVNWRM